MKAKVWNQTVTIPTYGVGEPSENPMFFEKRVYQASSGRVYPYPVIETVEDTCREKEYQGYYLENDYIKVLVLPELGGRIQTAVDKTNNYDFVYRNDVIKPALVGLLGPWISGGIEFNWPQHHRPTTFMGVDCTGYEDEDGAHVKIHDRDRMYGTEVITTFTLEHDASYIKVDASMYNPTSGRQTFLWWANPAVAVNDYTRSIFPPDVHAVFDHGKRAVSTYPIATGEYYKHDYSLGVDISRYRNIPVPTSFMAAGSNYDFVGGYDYQQQAGLLHVADHHVSPGKKQWTWGNGDFGQAWDRNLTDENGPYIELMTGVYTDNQPDFTWLDPMEEKHFTQYFMPYRGVGEVKNADKDFVLGLECEDGEATVRLYATSKQKAVLVLTGGGRQLLRKEVEPSPDCCVTEKVAVPCSESGLEVFLEKEGRTVLSYKPEEPGLQPVPSPAEPAKKPEQIKSQEELYLTAQHIEQYRHATFLPDPYYEEALKRDSGDSRVNLGYGLLKMSRGLFKDAERHFRTAIERLTAMHPNPYDSSAYQALGYSLRYQGCDEKAYDAFFKATWTQKEAAQGYFEVAVIDMKRGEYRKGLRHVVRALQYNSRNWKARTLEMLLLLHLGERERFFEKGSALLEENPFSFAAAFLLESEGFELSFDLKKRMRDNETSYLAAADYLIWVGEYALADSLLSRYEGSCVMVGYYRAYCTDRDFSRASATPSGTFFAHTALDQIVLECAAASGADATALYLLGNHYYDKMRYQEALDAWRQSAELRPEFPTVHRNLALILFNKKRQYDEAWSCLERAYSLNEKDGRVLSELDQMARKLNHPLSSRLARLEARMDLVLQRDDLKVSYVTLLNGLRRHSQALAFLESHRFHPWEGGEGKVTGQYVLALRELARERCSLKQWDEAEALLRRAFEYPHNLGEGKLEGDRQNDIHYLLAKVLQAQGRSQEAAGEFRLATVGNQQPAGVMFYYDQPADMILYQALALRELGDNIGWASRCNKLYRYGEQHYRDHLEIDYFAVSLPDMQLFDEDLDQRNRIHCLFLMALGLLGKGEREKAENCIGQVLGQDCSHIDAALLLRE